MNPAPEELAEKLGMPLEKVRKVLKIAKEPISLETPIGDEEDSHLGDFIEDKNAVIPLDAAIQANLREATTRVLSSLTPREERVLRMRFGIGMNTDHTLEEVGQQFNVTRERIRQIEGEGVAQTEAPEPQPKAPQLPGRLIVLGAMLGKARGSGMRETEIVTRVGVTVTFLRMTERQSGPHPALPADAEVRRSRSPTNDAYRALQTKVGHPYLWWLRRVMPDAELTAVLRNPQIAIHVLYLDGEEAGFYELDATSWPYINLSYFRPHAACGRPRPRRRVSAACDCQCVVRPHSRHDGEHLHRGSSARAARLRARGLSPHPRHQRSLDHSTSPWLHHPRPSQGVTTSMGGDRNDRADCGSRHRGARTGAAIGRNAP